MKIARPNEIAALGPNERAIGQKTIHDSQQAGPVQKMHSMQGGTGCFLLVRK